jgi:hypothetical protein
MDAGLRQLLTRTAKLKDIGGKNRTQLRRKKIPSGFFEQKDVENISAVIFTNTCESQKFAWPSRENTTIPISSW